MEIALQIALITAITSLIVSLLSIITTIITNRQSAKSAKVLEGLKFEYAKREKSLVVADAQLEKALVALQNLIQGIQKLKDEIQLILSSVETSLDAKTAINRVSRVRQELFDCYEKELTDLNEYERTTSHRSKNLALVIENTLLKLLNEVKYASKLSDAEKDLLMGLRDELTDFQNTLRDSRMSRIAQRIGGSHD